MCLHALVHRHRSFFSTLSLYLCHSLPPLYSQLLHSLFPVYSLSLDILFSPQGINMNTRNKNIQWVRANEYASWTGGIERASKRAIQTCTHAYKQKHANLSENHIVFCFHPGLLILLDSQMPLFLCDPPRRNHIIFRVHIFMLKKNSPTLSLTNTHTIRWLFTALSSHINPRSTMYI